MSTGVGALAVRGRQPRACPPTGPHHLDALRVAAVPSVATGRGPTTPHVCTEFDQAAEVLHRPRSDGKNLLGVRPRVVCMNVELPDLDKLFYAKDNCTHASDSSCISLDWAGFPDERSKWSEVRDQHLQALVALADHAAQFVAGHTGWLLGRPLLLEANQAAELALKTELLPYKSEWPKGAQGHELRVLLDLDRDHRPARPKSAAWEDQFVQLLERAWEAGRYPDGHASARYDQQCCVSADVLVTAVQTFAAFVSQ